MAGDNEGTLNFNGIFPHKNFLGQVMATGALATLHGIRIARRHYLGKLCMLLVFVGMAYASKSTGALLATCFSAASAELTVSCGRAAWRA